MPDASHPEDKAAIVVSDVRAEPSTRLRRLGAVVSSMRYAFETSGLLRGTRALLAVNQKDGFDCPGCAWPDPEHRAAFEFCENGARAVAHEADTRKVDAAFFDRHAISDLKAETDHFLEHQGRLVTPAFKRKGSDHYEAISYDEAFEIVARALRDVAGPNDAVFYTSGRTSNEAAFLYQLFARTFGTNNLPDCSNMCHESSGKGLGSTIGIGKGTVTLADFDEADCILIIGQNPGTNHPRMLTTLAAASKRGCRIVSINPLRERALESFAHPQTVRGMLGVGTTISSHYVQVRINGDVALLKGVMKEVLALEKEKGGVLDRAFFAEHTSGFEALEASLAAMKTSELVEESGVSHETMREIAEVYASSERVIACWAMGITQHENGVDNVREILNLLLLRGNIGRAGAGVCPVRGHSNVQGDRTVGIYEAPSEAFLARIDAATGIVSPRVHGYDAVATLGAMEEGRVRVFMALGGNFAAATPDTARTFRALAKVGLTVQVSTKLNRSHLETGEAALILPCLGRSERDERGGKPQFVTVENSMGIVHTSEGRLPPAAPLLESEPGIVASIAERVLGAHRPIAWRALAADYDRIRDLIEKGVDGFDDYNERVRTPGGFALPNGPRHREWKTKEKRALFSVVPLVRRDLGSNELVLMTIRSHDQFNTTVYGLHDRYRGIRGNRRVVFLNAGDMKARELVEGQLVDLKSHHGGTTRVAKAFACIPYDIPPRCAAAYFPETNALVALESFARESRTPASKSIIITIEPETA